MAGSADETSSCMHLEAHDEAHSGGKTQEYLQKDGRVGCLDEGWVHDCLAIMGWAWAM